MNLTYSCCHPKFGEEAERVRTASLCEGKHRQGKGSMGVRRVKQRWSLGQWIYRDVVALDVLPERSWAGCHERLGFSSIGQAVDSNVFQMADAEGTGMDDVVRGAASWLSQTEHVSCVQEWCVSKLEVQVAVFQAQDGALWKGQGPTTQREERQCSRAVQSRNDRFPH